MAKSSSSKRLHKPRFFATPAAFRAWLEAHHTTTAELIVGFRKKSAGKPNITWAQAVDQALCFGWIDGVRRKWDEHSYSNRFTPRRKGSNWSAINIRRVGELTAQGLMHQAGLEAFERRSEKKSGIYSYEQRHLAELEPAHRKQFERHREAWVFFQALPPGYRQLIIYRIVSAKRPETRLKRLEQTIAASARGKRL